MWRFAGLVIASTFFISPASATDSSLKFVSVLGNSLAAENFCGLKYDQAAISTFIENNIAADDSSFPSTLKLTIEGGRSRQKDMSASEKTAHCTQIKRVAKAYGFIKE